MHENLNDVDVAAFPAVIRARTEQVNGGAGKFVLDQLLEAVGLLLGEPHVVKKIVVFVGFVGFIGFER